MSDKIKYKILILVISVTLLMMVSIEPIGAPGDYLLESIGLKSWSSEHSGFHLAIIYFGVPFILGLNLLGHYRKKLRISGWKTFLYSIIIISCLKYSIIEIAEYSKGKSEGLLTIGFDSNESTYRIEKNQQYTKFNIQVKMTNYSSEKRIFKIAIDSRFRREENQDALHFVDSNGEDAIFVLEGKETRFIDISSENYSIVNEELDESVNSMHSSGDVQELILESLEGDKVKITSEGFFGVVVEVVR